MFNKIEENAKKAKDKADAVKDKVKDIGTAAKATTSAMSTLKTKMDETCGVRGMPLLLCSDGLVADRPDYIQTHTPRALK